MAGSASRGFSLWARGSERNQWGFESRPAPGLRASPDPTRTALSVQTDIDVDTLDVRGRQELDRGRRAYSPASLGGGAGEAGARGAEGPPKI